MKLTIYLLLALQFYLHKRNEKSVHTTETFARMFVAVLITAPNWKQCHCTHITWCICIMEYYSGIMYNKLQTITWTNLKNIMLRKISQTQKNAYCMISLYLGKANVWWEKSEQGFPWSFTGGRVGWESVCVWGNWLIRDKINFSMWQRCSASSFRWVYITVKSHQTE